MAKHEFLPGNTYGQGRPPLPEDLKEAKRLTNIDVQNLIYKFLEYSQADIKELLRDQNSTMKECLIAGIMAKALVEGDPARTSWLMHQIWGKEPEAAEYDNPAFLRKIPSSKIIEMIRSNQREEKADEAVRTARTTVPDVPSSDN